MDGPHQFKKNMIFFSARKLNFKETKRVLNNIYKCNQTYWNNKYFKIIQDQLYYDKDNSKLKKAYNSINEKFKINEIN